VTSLYVLTECWAMLTLGGHFAWQLRREALETRNIGRYKLERRLGSGGMAEVWAAFDLTLKQRVALKTLSGHRPGSPQLERLEREVRALAELTHPNTVRVFDYGVTEDGLWYYAMELLHGETLRDLVLRERGLPAERVLRIARQVLRALGEAHDKGIIHRDIKPENVFIAEVGGEADVAKLLDFGIAKVTLSADSRLTNTGCVAGTPAYLAPELILGRSADIRSDIYSFGATLYFALSAQLPFPEKDAAMLFAAHLQREPEPLRRVAERPIPEVLARVVERCMAKAPGDRYPSAQALLDALQI
jgi:serine/threonine protein kinase